MNMVAGIYVFVKKICSLLIVIPTVWESDNLNLPLLLPLSLHPTQYLSNADERLKWQANALPTDDLCTENAIMIKRFNRYPLVIDPSGQATEFIMNEYKDRKITRTRYNLFS